MNEASGSELAFAYPVRHASLSTIQNGKLIAIPAIVVTSNTRARQE